MFSKFDTNPQSDELTAADLYDAQSEWEAEQYEDNPYDGTYSEEGMHPDNLYDGEPIMDLPDDLYMIFDDPDYWD